MKRDFDFSDRVLREARLRQWGLCAHCGDSLRDSWEQGHHVVPNQSGRIADREDAFLRSVDNCVILCDACHTAAHGHGNTRFGAVAGADWYPYSHGKRGQSPHASWRHRIALQWERLSARKG